MITFLNALLILSALFFLYIGVRSFVRFKRDGFWLFLTLLAFSFFSVGVVETKTMTTYQEPASMMVRDGTLVVIDSSNAVHVINEYENGKVCLEISDHKRVIPFFNETFVRVNTKCQNILK